MLRTIRAKFTKGAIVPLEPLDVEEGSEVLVTLEESPTDSKITRKGLSDLYGVWEELGITDQDIDSSRLKFGDHES